MLITSSCFSPQGKHWHSPEKSHVLSPGLAAILARSFWPWLKHLPGTDASVLALLWSCSVSLGKSKKASTKFPSCYLYSSFIPMGREDPKYLCRQKTLFHLPFSPCPSKSVETVSFLRQILCLLLGHIQLRLSSHR